jgi:hypothetical protein
LEKIKAQGQKTVTTTGLNLKRNQTAKRDGNLPPLLLLWCFWAMLSQEDVNKKSFIVM